MMWADYAWILFIVAPLVFIGLALWEFTRKSAKPIPEPWDAHALVVPAWPAPPKRLRPVCECRSCGATVEPHEDRCSYCLTVPVEKAYRYGYDLPFDLYF